MTTIPKGQTVRLRIDGKKAFGWVRTEAAPAAGGWLVKVQLLPDFAHLLPTGWTDASPNDLTPVRICGCATLGYRPQHGDNKGKLFTTGCDFSRMPGRNSKFLPGHDAKAKGFLIKASGETSTLENGLGALETAREFGDKIAMKVAEGMDNARKNRATQSRSKRPSRKPDAAPAQREDELSEAQKIRKELKVTDPMLMMMIRGAVDGLEAYQGAVSGPTGTQLALKERKLTSWGRLTDLGYRACDLPTLAEENPAAVVCKDAEGSYSAHAWERMTFHWDCRRCHETADEI